MFRFAFAIALLSATVGLAADPAKPPPKVTQPADLALPPGFEADLLLISDAPTQGSWINLGKDRKGRLIIGGQQKQPTLRVTLKDGKPEKVDTLTLPITEIMGILDAHDSLYVNGSGPQGFGLYRLRDADGDDQYEDIKFLKRFQGGGEHGPHGVALGSDGHIYIMNGNHTDVPEGLSPTSPFRNAKEDILLPRQWDAGGHAVGKLAPGGYVVRTDAEGKTWELVNAGFRNAYDIAFNGDGELFTFDSDMEWDWGMPWYRPTRVNHCVSGGETGWRSGSAGKSPGYYPDLLPTTVDVGIGSPTGVTNGIGAKFPAKYQKAVYILDWTYGRIFAVHLKPDGASYTGTLEEFVTTKTLRGNGAKTPLNVTDAVIGDDGAMYFTIGGRNNQAALYRVRYTGKESTEPADLKNADGAKERALRHDLEAFHGKEDAKAIATAWPHLGHADRYIRFAARVAVEHQPISQWRDKALVEKEPRTALAGLLALARYGTREDQPALLTALDKFSLAKLPEDLQLEKLRILGISFARQGLPALSAARKVIADADAVFPAKSESLNRELAQVLIYLNAPGIAAKALKLSAEAKTQEEQLFYAFHLRTLPVGFWTLDQRKEHLSYFNPARQKLGHPPEVVQWFAEAGQTYRDGASYGKFLNAFVRETVANYSDSERKELADTLAKLDKAAQPPPDPPARPVFKAWVLADVLPKLEQAEKGRNFDKGREAYVVAQCAKCHRFGDIGGAVGPDLTSVATRFDRRALLESIIEPSKVVSDQYQNEVITTQSGKVITGRVVDETKVKIAVQTQPLSPERVEVLKADLDERMPSKLSPMPEHLVDVLTEEEVLDLLAYLESGGRKDFRAFKK